MKSYLVLTPVMSTPGKKAAQPGKVVQLEDDDADELLAIGAVAEMSRAELEDRDPNDLTAMTNADLAKIAKAEAVEVEPTSKKADLIAAIKKKRAEVKKAADEAVGQGGGQADPPAA